MAALHRGAAHVLRGHGADRAGRARQRVTQGLTDPGWARLLARFGPHPGVRSVIVVELDLIADSCGYSVPTMTEAADRDLLDRWSRRPDTLARREARADDHRHSIDQLPALAPRETDPAHQHS